MKIGLISDAHVPERCAALPARVPDLFSGVDLILHAGDVGDLSVIRQLERIAPVIAVHGNDEPPQTVEALPPVEVVALDPGRLALLHGHDRNPRVEGCLRRTDRWNDKLSYWAQRGREQEAGIVVYGHTHVPAIIRHGGVELINPGALASGTFFHRQTVRTVAILTVQGRETAVDYVNVDTGEAFEPGTDWDRGFAAAVSRIHQPIVDSDVLAEVSWMREELLPLAREHIISRTIALAQDCWFGDRRRLSAFEFVVGLLTEAGCADAIGSKLRESPRLGPHVDRALELVSNVKDLQG